MASTRILVLAAAALAAVGSPAAAQSPETLTAAQVAVACASPPVLATATNARPHIVGSQDVVQRTVFGSPELLVVDAGTGRGLQVNQQYFVRRPFVTPDMPGRARTPTTVETAGWVRIVAVNATTAIAATDHACSDIREGDYLEPFVAPALPPGDISKPDTTGELDFPAYSRVLYAARAEHTSAGTGGFLMMDHGADRGVVVGSHFAIYRDLQVNNVPLTAIGEATAVSVGPNRAVLLITTARDAVYSHDILVPRRDTAAEAGRQASRTTP